MKQIELSTADAEGRRKWIYPLVVKGAWWLRRKVLAYGLIAWLLAAPWISIGSGPAVFFDLVHRKIHFLGLTFWVNETVIFLSFVLFLLSSVLVLTAVLGRVFCGWACPQTVFMEFVFRPIERFLEGMGANQKNFYATPFHERFPHWLAKWSIFLVIALVLGNTLVAYLFGTNRLLEMMAEGPSSNWGPFVTMLIASGIILFQFGWFREQVCLFVCPYGRLQSVLLDRDSLIVAYDKNRGEPRGKAGKTSGDCVDCKMCVNVCPTGIDIRNGLQMECVHCTLCVDACDSIMDKLGRARGLIRYQTEAEVEGAKRRVFRPRMFVYSFLVLIFSGLVIGLTATRKEFHATVHRESGRDIFDIGQDRLVSNPVRIHFSNYSLQEKVIHFQNPDPTDLQIVVPQGEMKIPAGEKLTVHLLLKLPPSHFHESFGLKEVMFEAADQQGMSRNLKIRMVGPAGSAP